MENDELTLKVELTQKEVELIFDYRKIAPKWQEIAHIFLKVFSGQQYSETELRKILDRIP